MAYNDNVIRSDDPQALEKLQSKLAECEKSQEFMKKVNAYYRKNGTCKGCEGVADTTAQKIDDSMNNTNFPKSAPFPQYTAVGMIDIPDEKEMLDIINKIQENPQMYKVG